MEPLCRRIVSAWEGESHAYYAPEDLARGSLIAHDRQGQQQVYPLVGVSIGVVTNIHRSVTTMEEFSRIAAEVKARRRTSPAAASISTVAAATRRTSPGLAATLPYKGRD